MTEHRYGCRRDVRDARDHELTYHAIRLPASVDLRDKSAPVQDQGDLGACTSHGIIGAARDLLIRRGSPDVELSRLALYWQERFEEQSVSEDAGAEIRTGIKCTNANGLALESIWPYDVNRFAETPPGAVYDDGVFRRAITYKRVPVDNQAIKQSLAQRLTVIIGLSLYDSFESDEVARTGVVPIPNLEKESLVGGHCMRVLGYEHGHYIVRNNWAISWGDKGDCYIQESLLSSKKFGSDYWVIQAES